MPCCFDAVCLWRFWSLVWRKVSILVKPRSRSKSRSWPKHTVWEQKYTLFRWHFCQMSLWSKNTHFLGNTSESTHLWWRHTLIFVSKSLSAPIKCFADQKITFYFLGVWVVLSNQKATGFIQVLVPYCCFLLCKSVYPKVFLLSAKVFILCNTALCCAPCKMGLFISSEVLFRCCWNCFKHSKQQNTSPWLVKLPGVIETLCCKQFQQWLCNCFQQSSGQSCHHTKGDPHEDLDLFLQQHKINQILHFVPGNKHL